MLPGGSELPVLLRPCRVAGSGDGDASVVVDGPVALNPALARELARRSAGAVDLHAVLGDRLRTSGNGFDPYPLLDLVQAALPAVPGASLRRRLLLAPVSLDGDRVVSDLDRLRATVPAASPLSWVGRGLGRHGRRPARPRGRRASPDLGEPEQGVLDLLDRFSPDAAGPRPAPRARRRAHRAQPRRRRPARLRRDDVRGRRRRGRRRHRAALPRARAHPRRGRRARRPAGRARPRATW